MSNNSASTDAATREAAAGWFVRLSNREAGPSDWHAFTRWLETSPHHASAYDEVCAADDDLVALCATEPEAMSITSLPANDQGPTWYRKPAWATAMIAIAASFFLAILVMPQHATIEWRSFETAPGETHTIALDGGSRIELNGATRIRLADGGSRQVQLLEGQAAFYVVDSARAPFEVAVGGLRLVDQGTVFDVVRDGGWVRVGVSQGEILVNPDRERISLTAGRSLSMREGSGSLDVGRADPSVVAGWREGRLAYSDAPVTLVAADLARNLGVAVSVDDGLGDRRFTGVVQLEGDPAAIIASTAGLFDGRAVRAGDGWTIRER